MQWILEHCVTNINENERSIIDFKVISNWINIRNNVQEKKIQYICLSWYQQKYN